jgi:hypothetical protein
MSHNDNVCDLMAEHGNLKAALKDIEAMPFSMVNDSESLRHTIRALQAIARATLAKAKS